MLKDPGVNRALSALLEKEATTIFVDGFEVTDPETLGIVISCHYEWSGRRICEAFMYALEDANFHSLAEKVRECLDNELSDGEDEEEYGDTIELLPG